MRSRWMIAAAAPLLALAVVIVYSQGAGQAQTRVDGLTVTKSVDKPAVAPGERVIYTVMINNTTGEPVEVPSVVDTLPGGFEYIGLAWNSEWETEPWDSVPPVIQWAGPMTIDAFDSLALRYWVHVPESVPLRPEPYTNTVVVSETYQDKAELVVGVGEVTLVKSATPTRVSPGDPVIYTLTFDNSGYVTMPLDSVTDVLPPGVTFEEMTDASDIPDPPSGSTGTIVWSGPYAINPQDELLVQYRTTMPAGDEPQVLSNEAWGLLGDDTVVGPDSVDVRVAPSHPTTIFVPLIPRDWAPAVFQITKTANPTVVYAESPGHLITYRVVIANKGDEPGELADIHDTLPAGFTFDKMLAGSDISTPPTGTTGEIVWSGPFAMPGGSSLTLVYQVRAATVPGTYVNSANVTVLEGMPPLAPAKATVRAIEPILLEEDWESPSTYWRPFTNYWRLKPQQWYTAPGAGVGPSTALKHTCWRGFEPDYTCGEDGGAHDALLMYLEPGSFNWADYRFEVTARLNDTGVFQGMWFRGYWEESDLNRQYVTGYYLDWRVNRLRDNIRLARLPASGDLADPSFLAVADYPMSAGDWYRIKVEVQGSNIKAFINNQLVINVNDDTWPTGTVGFFAYKVMEGAWDNVLVEPLQ
jgi:uncharacterized repeat protein (TIGR01451 family)